MFYFPIASKHAIEGFAKCLRQELSTWGIHVCNINPGFMKTPLITSSYAASLREFEQAPKDITTQYSVSNVDALNTTIKQVQENPSVVVDKLVYNITVKRPVLFNPAGYQGLAVRIWISAFAPALSMFLEDFSNKNSGYGPTKEALKQFQGY